MTAPNCTSPGTSAYPDLNDAAHQQPDIVERLREKRGVLDNRWPGPTALDLEAANEIERLRAGLAQTPILWCCHVRGPDDVYAAPDYITALAWSDAMNEINWRANSRLNLGDPTSFQDCLIKAVPAPWPHSAEAHAKNLPESIKGFSDPCSLSSTVQRRPDETGDEYEARVGLISLQERGRL